MEGTTWLRSALPGGGGLWWARGGWANRAATSLRARQQEELSEPAWARVSVTSPCPAHRDEREYSQVTEGGGSTVSTAVPNCPRQLWT